MVILKVIEDEGDNKYQILLKRMDILEEVVLVKTTVVVSEEMVDKILIGIQKNITNWKLHKGNPLMTHIKTKYLIRIISYKSS